MRIIIYLCLLQLLSCSSVADKGDTLRYDSPRWIQQVNYPAEEFQTWNNPFASKYPHQLIQMRRLTLVQNNKPLYYYTWYKMIVWEDYGVISDGEITARSIEEILQKYSNKYPE